MGEEDVDARYILFATRLLNQGHSRDDVRNNLTEVGYTEEQAATLVEIAENGITMRRAENARSSRIAGLCIAGFGVLFLGFIYNFTPEEVPVFRQGRLLLGYAVGFGALAYGLWIFLSADWPDAWQ